MKNFKVTNNCSLKDFTDFNYPQGSFCYDILIKNKDIKVNGARVNADIQLKTGDTVTYYTTQKQESMQSHVTVYSDGNVYIADKLSGVTSEALLSELCASGEFYAVHRLDRNTQGLMAFAKNKEVYNVLLQAFKERSVEKKYLAVCKNNFVRDSGILTAFLLKDDKNSVVKISDKEINGAVKIVTEYSVLKRKQDLALAEITLHTGKTHQIRAHTAHIGCPVLGDEKYGDRALNKKYRVKRQKLVAASLKFMLNGKFQYLNEFLFKSSFAENVFQDLTPMA